MATQDQVIPTDGQHRADSRTTEVRASHLVPLSKPDAVAAVILAAARAG